jgi:putative ABC transport system permease protein
MISPYIKTAFRSISRNILLSTISITGLGVGLGCVLLLLTLVIHETSFDRFMPDYRNTYLINHGTSAKTPYPLAEAMQTDFPEIREFFRFYQTNGVLLRDPHNKLVRENNFGFSDPSVFRVLGIEFITGRPAVSKSEVAISEKTASKYFRDMNPLGSVLSVKLNDSFIGLEITGVYYDFPSNSTLFPDFIADIELSEEMFKQFQRSLGEFSDDAKTSLNWAHSDYYSYVLVERNTDMESLAMKMEKYKDNIQDERIRDRKYSFQQVSRIYHGSSGIEGSSFSRRGNSNELKYYGAVSFLILLIAITNYILLTRAGTADRLRELGTRKVLGASRVTIRKQIILESNIVAVISFIPAVMVIFSGIKFVNDTLGKTLTTGILKDPFIWLLFFLVIIFTGTISGFFIGSRISRIPSLILLSGEISRSTRSGKWNYSFLVLHFTIYIILVSGVMMVSRQVKYSLSNFTGIIPGNIIISELNSEELKSGFPMICNEMEKIPGVIKTAGSSFIPPFNAFLPVSLATAEGEKVRFDGLIMGEGVTELLGIELIDGEHFGAFQETPREIILNESGATEYNVRAGDQFMGFMIRGIVKDFNAHSTHSLIQPMVILQQNPSRMGLLAIRTDGKNDKAVISRLGDLYSQISPDEIFEVRYLTDQIRDFYRSEKDQGRIMGIFSLLAAVLAIMGLFGITLISITKRTKEIGIRKVNGATIAEILYLLNIDFIRRVMISVVIAVPVSVYLLSEWLKRFAYNAGLSWWIFVLAALSALIIVLLTVSWQSWRAATRNPVEALRYE